MASRAARRAKKSVVTTTSVSSGPIGALAGRTISRSRRSPSQAIRTRILDRLGMPRRLRASSRVKSRSRARCTCAPVITSSDEPVAGVHRAVNRNRHGDRRARRDRVRAAPRCGVGLGCPERAGRRCCHPHCGVWEGHLAEFSSRLLRARVGRCRIDACDGTRCAGSAVRSHAPRCSRQSYAPGRRGRSGDTAIRSHPRRCGRARLRTQPSGRCPAHQSARAGHAGRHCQRGVSAAGLVLNQATQPSRSLLDGGGLGGASIVTDQGSYDVGVSQRVRWGGGRYDVTWNSSRLESTNTFTNFNPSLAATASLTYTQPLLRGFRTDNERTQLVVSRIDRDISDIDLEETIVNTLADVRLAYWELVHARAAVEVQRQSLELAERLVRDNRVRVSRFARSPSSAGMHLPSQLSGGPRGRLRGCAVPQRSASIGANSCCATRPP